MRRIVFLFMFLVLGVCLFSCENEDVKPPKPEATKLATPNITLTNNVVSWEVVPNAAGYVVNKNGKDEQQQSVLSYEVKDTQEGDYNIKVKAITGDSDKYLDSDYSKTVTYKVEKKELTAATLFVVGDSTLASFNDNYYYPRYGYATQLENYFDKKITVKNLALSGRSSKNYIQETQYQTLLDEIKSGDYLLIGFGHNDEKNDDETRFTDASKPLSDPTSFQYSLYEYYVKVALEKNATPILCTPVVRADSSNNYAAASGHITANGDYAQAIVDLGTQKNVTVINLRDLTKAKYTTLGYDQAIYYHAILTGEKSSDGTAINPDLKSVDKTHLNIYGAKYIAYLVASELAKSNNSLGQYVLPNIVEPTKDKDLVKNPNYVLSDYKSPNLSAYEAPAHFTTITDGWYGTGFGDTGGTPNSAVNGFVAKETEEGVFQVGQHLEGSNKGKFSSSGEGFAFVFQQLEKSKNFEITAEIKVIATVGTKQVGFGLMLRDDCFINQTVNSAVSSNYVTAGFLMNDGGTTNILFKRENSTLVKGSNVVNSFIALDDTATLTISRTGQSITTTVIYKDTTYTETTFDFDLFAKDTEYMYIGLFANRGTIIEATNVVLKITGESLGA